VSVSVTTSDAICQSLMVSLQRGHWRVAIRQFLMLQVVGGEMPHSAYTQCQAHMERCPPRDLQKIGGAVREWAQMGS